VEGGHVTARGGGAPARPRIADWDPERAARPLTPEAFLEALPGPLHVCIPGRDRSRRRVWVTLLHGNEPSGMRALHAWLRGGPVPAVDLHAFVVSVAAARAGCRMLPGEPDLNRCFAPPFGGASGALAHELLQHLHALAPEAIADVHNTSRPSPPYCVAEHEDARHLALAAHLAPRFILSRIRLGTLTEAFDAIPALTFESGGAGTDAADRAAAQALERYASASDVLQLPAGVSAPGILRHPVRVELAPGVRAAYADAHVEGVDITLRSDIDRYVFEPVDCGLTLGWIPRAGLSALRARAEDGADVTTDLFELRGNRLLARRALDLLMVMTDAEGARLDCLFYAVVRSR
jgi:predicted deacylase